MAQNQRSNIKRIVAQLVSQGWTCRKTGKNHVQLYPADKRHAPFTVGAGTADQHGINNALKDIRKAGGIIK